MQQLSLQPDPLKVCPWAREAWGKHGTVLAVPDDPPLELLQWLGKTSWRLRDMAKDRGQAALLLAGDNPETLTLWLPPPPSHGSNTPGNLLPW